MYSEETPFTPYEIQRALGVPVDGKWGPLTERSARLFLGNPKDNTGRPWGRHRLILGVQQKMMAKAGINVTVDGLPGQETFEAFDKWRKLQFDPVHDKVSLVQANMWDLNTMRKIWAWFRRPEPKEPEPVIVSEKVVQPAFWPRQSEVVDFYGENGQIENMVKVKCPWTLTLCWDKSLCTDSILIHKKCADSLKYVLKEQMAHYGEEGIRKLGVHMYGGSYNNRKMRGSNTWSMHAYGCAIDFDPDRNQLHWDHTKARLAQPDAEAWWKIWETAGWVSLGRERDFDWMHVQAARL